MAGNSAIGSFNLKGLEQLAKALKGTTPTIKIGILGSHDTREDGLSNASIGAAHEFGSGNLPMRSFLRVPIATHLEKEMERSDLFDKDVLNNVVKHGSILPWMDSVATCALAVVDDAFHTGGDGEWAPHAPSTQSKTGELLIDTGQLRRSISSEIK